MKSADVKLVELKPLAPFSGSYPCRPEVADVVEDRFIEDEQTGVVTKRRISTKRFAGKVPVQRRAWPSEVAAYREGNIPEHITVIGDLKLAEVWIEERAPTVLVPEPIALDLVKRGLAEKVAA